MGNTETGISKVAKAHKPVRLLGRASNSLSSPHHHQMLLPTTTRCVVTSKSIVVAHQDSSNWPILSPSPVRVMQEKLPMATLLEKIGFLFSAVVSGKT